MLGWWRDGRRLRSSLRLGKRAAQQQTDGDARGAMALAEEALAQANAPLEGWPPLNFGVQSWARICSLRVLSTAAALAGERATALRAIAELHAFIAKMRVHAPNFAADAGLEEWAQW